MSCTLGETHEGNANSGDLLMRFNTLRQKYEDCLAESKVGIQGKAQVEYLERIRSEFNTLKKEFNVF